MTFPTHGDPFSMPTITDILAFDHARCDELFAGAEERGSLRQWESAGIQFSSFREAMEQHFSVEETLLFPAFEHHTGHAGGPTQVMRMEHTQMRELMDEMAQSIAARDRDAYLGQSETLLMIMRQHNLKEEQMLYPMADQVLGDNASELISGIQAALPEPNSAPIPARATGSR